MNMNSLKCMVAATLLASGLAAPASADTVAFIGTGNVAGFLGTRFAQMGHDIVYGHREPQREDNQELASRTGNGTRVVLPAEAVVNADIVVIAVPGGVLPSVAAALGDLSGKIVIDPTNPLYPDPDDGLANYLFPISNAEMIQNMYPDAYVVKAFNTLTVASMANPAGTGGPITIPIAGNDADAKAIVAELIEAIGIQAVDVGPVRFAYVLEGMRGLAANGRDLGHEFDYHFQLH